jgi:hypothetical protein
MKKAMTLLAFTVAALACCGPVSAAGSSLSSALWRYQIDASTPPNALVVQNGIHANGYGRVTFTSVRGGGVDITVQLSNGAPNFAYILRAGGIERGRFMTNKKGNATFTFHVADASVSVLGDSINIWAYFVHFPPPNADLVDMTGLLWCATNPIQ